MKDQIRFFRQKIGMTQEELASAIGYESASAITMWESGDRKPPSDKIPDIARALGCEIQDLFATSNPTT